MECYLGVSNCRAMRQGCSGFARTTVTTELRAWFMQSKGRLLSWRSSDPVQPCPLEISLLAQAEAHFFLTFRTDREWTQTFFSI